MAGCDELVMDWEHYEENMTIANAYGSELAGNFGMILCEQPVVWGGKCELHKRERRKSSGDRRRRGRDAKVGS